jgi:hypothetical protein
MGTSSDTRIWRISGGTIQLRATTENWRTLHIQQLTGRCRYSRGYLVRSWHLTGTPLNFRYSSMQTCVEWGYTRVVRYWANIDFKKQMKLERERMEAMWHVAFWLTNVVTCHRGGNQISEYLEITLPTAEEDLTKTLAL